MNEIAEIENKNIEDMIYEIRGKQVMLDHDLAKLYHVETKRINEAVKNNPLKFPERFCFRIMEEEYLNLKSKISTSSLKNTYGGSRKGHTVFTEQGVAMLATILKSKIAAEVSIRIMDAFVAMRKYISNNLIELTNINNMLIRHENKFDYIDNEIKLLQEAFNKLEKQDYKNKVFMDGKIYDAYSEIINILDKAKKDIIIIDNYADKFLLDIISNLNKNIILITKDNNSLKKIDIQEYNKQYNNLKIIYNNDFHDRFIILDNKVIYHLGSSINHIGNKVVLINKIEEKDVIDCILDKINKVI